VVGTRPDPPPCPGVCALDGGLAAQGTPQGPILQPLPLPRGRHPAPVPRPWGVLPSAGSAARPGGSLAGPAGASRAVLAPALGTDPGSRGGLCSAARPAITLPGCTPGSLPRLACGGGPALPQPKLLRGPGEPCRDPGGCLAPPAPWHGRAGAWAGCCPGARSPASVPGTARGRPRPPAPLTPSLSLSFYPQGVKPKAWCKASPQVRSPPAPRCSTPLAFRPWLR